MHLAIKQCVLLHGSCNFVRFKLNQYRWEHEIYMFIFWLSFFQFQTLTNRWIWMYCIYYKAHGFADWILRIHQAEIRYAFIVRWTSLGILKAFSVLCWMNLHSFCRHENNIFSSLTFFSLVQQWQWKNHLNFNGMESVIFNQNMICKLLKRYQIVKVNAR